MSDRDKDYISALRFKNLTRFYDPLIEWGLRERAFKSALIKQANIDEGQRVLDLACGTGTLTLWIKEQHPQAHVTGIDGDPDILQQARRKVEALQIDVTLDQGLSYELPYEDGHFDRVVSSLFFHHLTRENKHRTADEVMRVLRPGGQLHVADWGKARNALMRILFLTVQLLDGPRITSDNVRGLLPSYFKAAAFEQVETHRNFSTVLGTLSLYSARKPDSAGKSEGHA